MKTGFLDWYESRVLAPTLEGAVSGVDEGLLEDCGSPGSKRLVFSLRIGVFAGRVLLQDSLQLFKLAALLSSRGEARREEWGDVEQQPRAKFWPEAKADFILALANRAQPPTRELRNNSS